MKKIKFFALMSAIALTNAIGFSACSSSDEAVADVNPTFDGEAVKTQFTISFPQDVAKTRQTAGTVQASQDIAGFRGMDNIVLYPFAATAVGGANPVSSSSTKIGDAITLSKMLKPTSGNVDNSIPAGTTGLMATNNSVLFGDVTIPVGTGSFLFYGKAIDNTTYTDKFYNGSLTMKNTTAGTTNLPYNPSNIAFDLDPTYTATTASAVGAALATYLTNIAKAGDFNTSTKKSGWEATENTGLKDLYDKFVSLKAGSSLTVQAAVQDLYLSIWKNTDDVSTAIAGAITNSTYASANATTGVLTFTATLGNSDATYFPGDVNLPDGAALLTYDEETNTFSQSITGGDNTGLTGKYADYVYPASLYYYSNSGVKTSNSSQQSLYTTDKTWTQILDNKTDETNYSFPGNAVGPSTRSVAIIDPIQYAVGRLDMTVSALSTDDVVEDVGGTEVTKKMMYDKKGEAYDATAGFEVTGVLIGGQKQVGFDFTTDASSDSKTIYDNITKSQPTSTLTVTPSAASGTNYTLALETVKDQEVYVAVEFLNKGADFEGFDGVIPAGCKFYLVGKLSPTAGTENGVTGYDEDDLNQVFKQDYKTIATFKISKGTKDATNINGLGAAYNTIPDLRTPQLELGLSVNLEWESGIQFEVTF